jgi:hypothetical protein
MSSPIELFENLIKYPIVFDHTKYFIKNIVAKWDKFFTYFHVTYHGRYIYIPTDPNNYEKINIISDYFTEHARIQSRGYKSIMSVYECWHTESCLHKIVQNAITRYGYLTAFSLRESIYALKNILNEARQGTSTVYISLYNFFKAKKILDPASAWGDRLIAAIAYNAQCYYGIDPNPNLFNGYKEIKKMFLIDENKNNFKMIQSPFETAIINETFDFVILSPAPYIGEMYQGKDQSTNKYPKFIDWFINYMLFTVQKSYDLLELNGHIAITILDRPAYNYYITELLLLSINVVCPYLNYQGIIGWQGSQGSISPFFIWKKTSHKNSYSCKHELKEFYLDIYNAIKLS